MSKTKLMTMVEFRWRYNERMNRISQATTQDATVEKEALADKEIDDFQANAMRVMKEELCYHLRVSARIAAGVAVDDMGAGLLKIVADIECEYTPDAIRKRQEEEHG